MSGTRKRRVASTTTKARDAIAVAASESKDDEDAAEKPLRKRGRPPKKKDKKDDGLQDAPEDSDDQEEAVEEGKEGGIVIDWTKDLTWTLITGIEENEDIRRGLFPPPGSSKRNGGGFPKKHFQFMLARICFENHPDYSEAFKKCLTGGLKQQAKLQKMWFGKIKNRLKVVTTSARASIEMMGQTGAGLESADEILPDTPLQTKWDKIKEDSPWFWHMRSLIGERPNLRPVGIGNNGDNMDTSLLIPNADDNDVTHPSSPGDTLDFPERLADVGTDTDNDLYTMDLDDDDSDDDWSVKRGKRKRESSADSTAPAPKPIAKKTKPQLAVSTPAPAKLKKPATAKDKFSAAILAEEETAHRALGLQKDKNAARRDIALAKINAGVKVQVEKAKVKAQERLLRLELARLKMQQEHEVRMAQFAQSSHAGPSRAGQSSTGNGSLFSNNESFVFSDFRDFQPSDAGSSSAATPFGLDNDLHLPLNLHPY